jgi:hypothetical protein
MPRSYLPVSIAAYHSSVSIPERYDQRLGQITILLANDKDRKSACFSTSSTSGDATDHIESYRTLSLNIESSCRLDVGLAPDRNRSN